jgi:uncharacterized membrane protein YgdD (TMEM256/DUF423 family)
MAGRREQFLDPCLQPVVQVAPPVRTKGNNRVWRNPLEYSFIHLCKTLNVSVKQLVVPDMSLTFTGVWLFSGLLCHWPVAPSKASFLVSAS